MASFLEGSLALTIGAAFSNVFYAATVTRLTPGAGDAYNPGAPTEVDYSCKGMVEDYEAYQRDGTLIHANDRKVIILATSINIVPRPGDKVTIRGATYTVVPPTKADPALATYTLNARA